MTKITTYEALLESAAEDIEALTKKNVHYLVLIKELKEQMAELVEALENSIPEEEFNLSNYDHETVCRIHRMQMDCANIVDAALAKHNKGGA